MKVTLNKFNVVFAVVMAVALMGCGSSPASTQTVTQPVAPLTRPSWLNEDPPEDVLWGIGIAKLQNDSLAQRTATARARRDVAEQLKVLVQGMLIDYAREAGTLNNSSSIQFVEDIGKSIVNQELSGASPNKRESMPDGTWYVRVSIRKSDAKKIITDVYDNEAARYTEFKAREGIRMLDAELNKYKSQPSPRSED